MRNKIIFYVLTFFIITGFATSSYWIPKFRPFGTSTTLTDSTGYVTLNKGLYVQDSLKVSKDLYVGVKGGVIYLDTTRMGQIYYNGNNLEIVNNKQSGSMDLWIGNKVTAFNFCKTSGGTGGIICSIDTVTGLVLNQGNIQLAGTTQQIKLPSDTATDYDANDAITLNRQSGVLTTKSLTTGTNSLYVLALTNSLITANSKVLASLNDGTVSTGFPMLYQTRPASGSCNIVIWNASGTDAFNGTIKVQYVVFN